MLRYRLDLKSSRNSTIAHASGLDVLGAVLVCVCVHLFRQLSGSLCHLRWQGHQRRILLQRSHHKTGTQCDHATTTCKQAQNCFVASRRHSSPICLTVCVSFVSLCPECTILEKDRDGCPKIVNLGQAKTDMFYESTARHDTHHAPRAERTGSALAGRAAPRAARVRGCSHTLSSHCFADLFFVFRAVQERNTMSNPKKRSRRSFVGPPAFGLSPLLTRRFQRALVSSVHPSLFDNRLSASLLLQP